MRTGLPGHISLMCHIIRLFSKFHHLRCKPVSITEENEEKEKRPLTLVPPFMARFARLLSVKKNSLCHALQLRNPDV